MTFGERIVKAREAIGLSQKQLAIQLGITPTRLNYWEKDKRQPDVFMIKAMSVALGVTGDYLIGYETEKPADDNVNGLSEDRMLLVELVSKLTDRQAALARNYLELLLQSDNS